LKKYYVDGENALYEGNSIEVLKALKDSCSRKVDLVYIDPPFATNTDFRVAPNGGRTSTISSSKADKLAYSDKMVGDDYLEFLREVLINLKALMSDKASIYLHIDYKVGHSVKLVMDEVFGANNFKNDITRIKCNPKNFGRKAYGNIKDLILFYAWGDYTWNNPSHEYSERDIEKLFPKIDKNGRRYTTNPLHAPGETSEGPSGQVWNGILPPPGRHWRYAPAVLDDLERQGLIEWSATGNPRKVVYADDQIAKGKKAQDIWDFKDPMYPKYPTQKNLDLLKFIIEASSNPGDLVLDCFAGSATTLVASNQLGRNWIGIDQSKAALEVSRTRITQEL
jgi:adenine-specific DNA-methyltransferase